jgi:hypothetical protein
MIAGVAASPGDAGGRKSKLGAACAHDIAVNNSQYRRLAIHRAVILRFELNEFLIVLFRE